MSDDNSLEEETLTVSQEENGQRIDKILSQHYPDVSRHYFQDLILKEDVRLNGLPTLKRQRVKPGDVIEIRFRLTPEIQLTPEDIPLDILFEDSDIIAVNKPAGMTVHPAPGNWSGTFVNALVHHCKELEGDFSTLRPGVVHRLDKHTSGVLIAAKTKRAHLRLAELFAERRMQKEYVAICLGNAGSGTIENYLDRHPVDRKKRTVVEQGGKLAITEYKTLTHGDKLCLVKINLKTGRTHQIRVHMQFHGTPILGDPVYGRRQSNTQWEVERQLLHAQTLAFEHPFTGEAICLKAPLPEDMSQLLKQMPPVPEGLL
ncbi:MAG: RluA family pseudouridine synthase [Chlamydiia bacterium]|nr:RluA family pseudouridine synthase [Chlamydiia bacterium]